MTLPADIERVALLGWHLYPATRSKSRAAFFKGATDAATFNLEQLERWSDEYPKANWRVVMGPSRLWGLDVDAPGADHAADGIAALKALVETHGALPQRPTTRSGGGGMALFFTHRKEEISGKTGTPAPGIDPRRGRLSITIPPSLHHRTGAPYRWLIAPWEIAAPSAPDWLLEAVRPPPEPAKPPRPVVYDDTRGRKVLIRAVDAIRVAPPGQSNDTLNRKAYFVARVVAAGALSEVEAIESLYSAAMDRRIPRIEARDTIKSAFRTGLTRPVEASR